MGNRLAMFESYQFVIIAESSVEPNSTASITEKRVFETTSPTLTRMVITSRCVSVMLHQVSTSTLICLFRSVDYSIVSRRPVLRSGRWKTGWKIAVITSHVCSIAGDWSVPHGTMSIILRGYILWSAFTPLSRGNGAGNWSQNIVSCVGSEKSKPYF